MFRRGFLRWSGRKPRLSSSNPSGTSTAPLDGTPELSTEEINQPSVLSKVGEEEIRALNTTPANETNKRKIFKRESKRPQDKELKLLHYSYAMSESTLLREAVKLAYSLTETTQNGPTAQDCDELASLASGYIFSVINQKHNPNAAPFDVDSAIRELVDVLLNVRKKLYDLPQLSTKTVDDWMSEKVVTDQCRADLHTVISRSEETYLHLSHQSKSMSASTECATVHCKSDTSTLLGTSISLLTILNEAADIAPVPILKGIIGTILVILQTAETTRSNREDILEIANMAEDFAASIWEACQEYDDALPNNFQSAIEALTNVLMEILQKAQVFCQRSLLSRIVGQINDRNEIAACKQELQNALSKFQMITQVLQQKTLNDILAGQREVIESAHDMFFEILTSSPDLLWRRRVRRLDAHRRTGGNF